MTAPATFNVPLKAVEDPTLVAPCCERQFNEAGWRCLEWLQQNGTTQIRRCLCGQPVGRIYTLPMMRLLNPPKHHEERP